jgi:hypothetical protein
MPNFESYVDIDVDEFISNCSEREIKELIDTLKDDGHLPNYFPTIEKMSFLEESFVKKMSFLEESFVKKMSELSSQYTRISLDDEEVLEKLFKKYL